MAELINIVLLGIMVVSALAVERIHNLFAVAILTGIFSLAAAGLYVILDAVDVAFTEAAVGAGIATVLMLATLSLTHVRAEGKVRPPLVPVMVVLITGGALIYGTFDMPSFGDPNAPVHEHVAPRYVEESGKEVGVPNIVTSVLASYRGYDTLGEVTVIFTAAAGVLALLGQPAYKAVRRRRKKQPGPKPKKGRRKTA